MRYLGFGVFCYGEVLLESFATGNSRGGCCNGTEGFIASATGVFCDGNLLLLLLLLLPRPPPPPPRLLLLLSLLFLLLLLLILLLSFPPSSRTPPPVLLLIVLFLLFLSSFLSSVPPHSSFTLSPCPFFLEDHWASLESSRARHVFKISIHVGVSTEDLCSRSLSMTTRQDSTKRLVSVSWP